MTEPFDNEFECEVEDQLVEEEKIENKAILPNVPPRAALVLPEGFRLSNEADLELVNTLASQNRLIIVSDCYKPAIIEFR